MYDRLREHIDVLTPHIVAFTRDLLAVPGQPGQEREAAHRVEDQMRRLNYDLVFRDEIGNIIGIIAGTADGGTTLLHSSLDLIPEAVGASALINGRIYGAGTSSGRGALASQLFAGAVMNQLPMFLRGTVVVAVTTAGEGGCGSGTRYLMRKTLPALGLRPSYAILGEPTDLEVCVGHAGWMEVCIVLEGEDASEVLDLAYDMYARCRESCTDRSGVDGDTAFALMPPSIERGQSRTAARMCLFQSIPSNKMVREATADIRRRARRHAGGRGGVVLRVIPRTSTRRYYTGLDNGVLHVCLPWAAGSGVETPTVEHARAALLEAGWEHVRVGPWRSNHPRWGTVGGQMSHEHHVPSFAFGPGQSAGVAPASVTVRDLCEAVFGDVVITRQLIDFVRAGERVVSPSSA